MTTITNHEQAFEQLEAAHAYLNSCDDDGELCDELIALEDAIAETRVSFEKWQEANAFNYAVGDAGRRYRSAEQAYKESREMVL